MNTFKILSPLELYGEPDLVRIDDNMFSLPFDYMKISSVISVIDSLRKSIDIEGVELVETSSGTYAMSLALVSKKMGLKCTIILDGSVDDNMICYLELLGAKVIQMSKFKLDQTERLQFVKDYISESNNRIWLNQYDNSLHQDGYFEFGRKIVNTLGDVVLIGPVGSGSSTCGIFKGIRSLSSRSSLIGVDLQGSVIFGGNKGKRTISGIGSGLIPSNVEHSLYTKVHTLSERVIAASSRKMIRETGLLCGVTSAASYFVANYEKSQSSLPIVFLCPDTKERYSEFIKDRYLNFDIPLESVKPECHDSINCDIDWSVMYVK